MQIRSLTRNFSATSRCNSGFVRLPGKAYPALRCRTRHVLVGAVIITHLLLANPLNAQLFDAPRPVSHETKVEHRLRLTLLWGVGAARAADWQSTEHCLSWRDGQSTCHEAVLPQGLASSKAGLASFEALAWGLEFDLSRRMSWRHPKLALVGDAVSFASLATVVLHNYLVCRSVYSPGPPQLESPPRWRIMSH